MTRVRSDLTVMARPPVTLPPGEYRAYLAPAALREILELVCWEGFSLKAQRSARSPLLRMAQEGLALSPKIKLSEHPASGIGPLFTEGGFVRPPRVALIEQGVYRHSLAGPRSAREFGVPVNGDEMPAALDLEGGDLPFDQALSALGRGLWLNDVWYCNFSDRYACRVTGMTRFACCWVEDGKIRAPIEVMRFDDSLFRILGPSLVDLTRERELLLDPGTYQGRSTASMQLPGALVETLRLTL
jgi:predicted Zn-dependent protease